MLLVNSLLQVVHLWLPHSFLLNLYAYVSLKVVAFISLLFLHFLECCNWSAGGYFHLLCTKACRYFCSDT